MKRASSRPRWRGISRIDQPSTRTHGWFVRVGFYKRRDGTYVPRHRKFFSDATYGGKRRALRAAREHLATVDGSQRPKRTPVFGALPNKRLKLSAPAQVG